MSRASLIRPLLIPLMAGWLSACVSSGKGTNGFTIGDGGATILDSGPDALCGSGELKCGANASCIDSLAGSACVCNPGFTGDGMHCSEVNQCAIVNDAGGVAGCDPNASCVNFADAGVYSCACNPGYVGDGRVCAPADLCAVDGGGCGPNSTCSVVNAAVVCTCDNGFANDGGVCSPVAACETPGASHCDPNATCTDELNGGYLCSCKAGYQGNGYQCSDVDECAQHTDNCGANTVCTNTLGSFTCSCAPGYQPASVIGGAGLDTDGGTEDGGLEDGGIDGGVEDGGIDAGEIDAGLIDAGLEDGGIDAGEIDAGAIDAGEADAGPIDAGVIDAGPVDAGGTSGGALNCVDINECAELADGGTLANCAPGATCTNLPGSFSCACPQGFTGNGQTCTAVDLCSVGVQRCGINATCSSANGGFTCTCNSGYTGDGQDCTDINECAVEPDGGMVATCGADSMCVNTPGSYLCACNAGFSDDAGTCVPIDACQGNPCGANATCSYVGPSQFTCVCAPGYEGNGHSCTPVDECGLGLDNCSPNAACANAPGQSPPWSCVCNAGFNGNGQTCTSFDFCDQPVPPCPSASATCINTPGNYYCACPPGNEGGAGCHPLSKQLSLGATSGCRIVGGEEQCWGTSPNGALGLGPGMLEAVSATEVGSATDWVITSASSTHTCGIQSDNSLWCWGQANDTSAPNFGDIGSVPVQIGASLGQSWKDVSTGTNFTCAITSAGTLWCWGKNNVGQVGDSTNADSVQPHQIGTSKTWETVATGDHHACGINQGALWCWGGNEDNQLGIPNLPATENEPQLVDSTRHWASIRAGVVHTCALTDQGTPTNANTLWCWGDNSYGQIGIGTQTAVASPQEVMLTIGWSAVAAGDEHSCGIQLDGSLWCWGDNTFGELGSGTNVNALTPQLALTPQNATSMGWTALTAGSAASCAENSGNHFCWGSNESARLGLHDDASQDTPIHIAQGLSWAQLSAYNQTVCGVLSSDGSLWCWGDGSQGQIGNGSTDNQQLPVQVSNGVSGFALDQVSVGNGFACAVGLDQSLWCWGTNASGQLGVSLLTTQSATPVQASTNSTWLSVSAGGQHACGIAVNPANSFNSLYCWGSNTAGQTGSGVPNQFVTPLNMSTPISSVTNWALVATGDLHTCAVDMTGAMSCWGSNTFGQVGGATPMVSTPQSVVVEGAAGWSSLFLGTSMTCAITSNYSGTDPNCNDPSSMFCWGLNTVGQLGIGGTYRSLGMSVPAEISTPTCVGSGHPLQPFSWNSITNAGAASDTHTCALDADDSIWCWGEDVSGEFGDGILPTSPPSVMNQPKQGPPATSGTWIDVTVGHEFTCGVQQSSAGYCFGLNALGELGDGLAWYLTPSEQ